MENNQNEQQSNYETSFQVIFKEVESAGLLNDLEIRLKNNFTYSVDSKETNERNITCKLLNVNNDTITKSIALENKLKEDQSDIVKAIKIPINLKSGSGFPGIRNVEKLFEDVKTDIKHEQGQVLLLDIWATWCGPCQKPMEHNQKMLESNEQKWLDKVRIVGLSVDDEKETVVERVNSKNWKKVEHYRIPGGWDTENDAIKYFQVQGIPKVVLVSTNGTIVYTGHPSSINLEEEINNLLSGKNDVIKSKDEDDDEEKGDKQEESAGPNMTEQDFVKLEKAFKEDFIPFLSQQTEHFGFYFELRSEKVSQCGKDSVIYHPALIKYRCNIEQKSKLEVITNFLFSKADKNWIKDKGQIHDPKGQQMKHITKFCEIYQQFNVQAVQLSMSKSINVVFKKSFQIDKTNEIKQYKSLDINQFDISKKAEVNKKFIEYGDQLYKEGVEFDDIQPFLKQGLVISTINMKFPQMDNVHLYGSKDTLSLSHQLGEVLIVDFWAFWCGPCISAMKHNQKILDDNANKWGKNVRIVAVSLENENEEVKSTMEKFDWKSIQFYHTNDEFRQRNEMKLYSIRFIPHILLINQEGVIVYSGSPNEIKLEEKIQLLVDGKKAFDDNKDDKEGEFQNIYKQISTIFSKDNVKELEEQFNKLTYLPTFKISTTRDKIINYKGELLRKAYQKPTLIVKMRENDKNLANLILDKLNQGQSKDIIDVKEEYFPTINVPLGTICFDCKKKLGDQVPHYWSKFTNQFFCIPCGDSKNPLEFGTKKFLHPNNMIFINIKGNLEVLQNIDEYKFGKNLQPKDNEKPNETQSLCCNGCGGGAEGRRYICLSCRPGPMRPGGFVDFCQRCFDALNNVDDPQHKGVLDHCVNEGHKLDHLILKVLYNVAGYYDF